MEDKELVALFGEVHRRLDTVEGRFDTVEGRFDTVEGRFDTVEGRFDTIEGRLDGIDQRIDRVRSESAVKFERIERDLYQVTNKLKDLHATIALVAEGVINVDEKLERFRAETAAEFGEVRSEIRIGYTLLDQRIKNLEQSQ